MKKIDGTSAKHSATSSATLGDPNGLSFRTKSRESGRSEESPPHLELGTGNLELGSAGSRVFRGLEESTVVLVALRLGSATFLAERIEGRRFELGIGASIHFALEN